MIAASSKNASLGFRMGLKLKLSCVCVCFGVCRCGWFLPQLRGAVVRRSNFRHYLRRGEHRQQRAWRRIRASILAGVMYGGKLAVP